MVQTIKELRIKLDGLAQLTKELKPIIGQRVVVGHNGSFNEFGNILENSKEIEKAVDSLYLAKAWLGKVLGELGTENPYGSGYKTKEDIVPTQDSVIDKDGIYHSMFTIDETISWNNKNHIEKVDWLRCSIEDIIQEIIKLDLKGSRELAIARTNSYTYLCESKIYLGLELGRIRDSK